MINKKKTTFLASLGAGLEYYDFIVYGMMAPFLSTLFFPQEDEVASLLKTFAIFSVGYIVRPVGGVLFGLCGDTFGRKKAFFSIMLLMAVSTFCIGCLPTYPVIGYGASFLLCFFRILQGLSFGAELPTAITVVNEFAEKKEKGIFSGFVISSVSIGSTLAAFIMYLLSSFTTKEQILNGAWRYPFLFGGTLAIVNYFIRKNLKETPEFSSYQKKNPDINLLDPVYKLFKEYKFTILLGIGITSLLSALVIFSLYLPTYFTHLPAGEIYYAMTWGMIWSAISLPICGYIVDKIGAAKTFMGSSIAFTILAYPALKGVNSQSLILFMIGYQTILSFLSASYFPMIAAMFPTSVRVTGVAICYNVAYSIMSGLPLILTLINNEIWILGVIALVSALSASLTTRYNLNFCKQ